MIITHLPHRVVNRRKRPFLEYRPKSSSTVTPTYFDHFDENGEHNKNIGMVSVAIYIAHGLSLRGSS